MMMLYLEALSATAAKIPIIATTIISSLIVGSVSTAQPMIMSILGIIIGGLMVAMYLPIFMLGSVM